MTAGLSRDLFQDKLLFTCWLECVTSISIVMELSRRGERPYDEEMLFFKRRIKMASGPVLMESAAVAELG